MSKNVTCHNGSCGLTLLILGTFWNTNSESVVFEKCGQSTPAMLTKRQGKPSWDPGLDLESRSSWHDNVVEEADNPQIATQRSDILDEGCMMQYV